MEGYQHQRVGTRLHIVPRPPVPPPYGEVISGTTGSSGSLREIMARETKAVIYGSWSSAAPVIGRAAAAAADAWTGSDPTPASEHRGSGDRPGSLF